MNTGLSSSFKIDRLRYIDFSLHHRYFHTKELDCLLNVSCSCVISVLLQCFFFYFKVRMSKRRVCKLTLDYFCYVCGFYISPKQVKHNIVPGTKFCSVYKAYFGVPVGDLDKFWAPHVCRDSCRSTLEGWLCGTRKCMPFAIPRIWRQPTIYHHPWLQFHIVMTYRFQST
jgi:hypothetical protein